MGILLSTLFTETYLMIAFGILVILMLTLDLGVFNKKQHKVSNKEALIWSCVWVGLAIIFGGFVYAFLGSQKASEYYTAFIIEKALSVDNLFVFILVFQFFRVPDEYHHKVLFWGILGAIVLRAIFIFSGAQLISLTYLPDFKIAGLVINELNIILLGFGVFLVIAGIKSISADGDGEKDFSKSFGIRIIKKFFPVSEKFHGGKFFVRINGIKTATLLLLVVGVIEVTDVLFAVDSIPAIFTISRDPFILYSSNIFAILGLRTLYFLLANFMHLFIYLKYGLAFILSFIGLKMIIAPAYHISSPLSLCIVGAALIISIILSLTNKLKT